jgi:hypothetical protein
MPPAKFSHNHRLSVWRDYRLHMHCCRCEQRSTHIEVAGLIRWHGDKTFTELLPRLRCMFCKQRPTFLSLAPNVVRDAGETQGATWSLVLMTDDLAQL